MQNSYSVLPSPITIFISHSLADVDWCEKLKIQLAPLRRQGLIVNESAKRNLSGNAYASDIVNQIDNAQIILLLISQDYINSDQCYDIEMTKALARREAEQIPVIPVYLSAIISWENMPFGDLRPLPDKPIKNTSNSQAALFEVANGISELIKTQQQKQQPERPTGYRPITGLPLTHLSNTVPRTELVQQIYTTLTGPRISALTLVGLGGLGKSTLAALIYNYVEQQRASSSGPLAGKTLWLKIDATVTLADILGTIRAELHQPALNLANMTTKHMIWELSKTLQAIEQPCLIILDQFEELLNPQTGRAHVQNSGINEWLDTLNTQANTSRLLLTSRISPHGSRPAPPQFLREQVIPSLTLDEGTALLRICGIEAPEAQIQLAIEHCQGHALALVLLSRLLLNDPGVHINTFFEHSWYKKQRTETMAQELLNYIFTQQLDQDQRDLLTAFAIYREAVPVEAAQTAVAAYNKMSLERITVAHRILLAQHLLESSGKQRYQSQRLVAEFARQQIEEQTKLAKRVHTQAAHYYQRCAMTSTPPRKQRGGIDDTHNFIEAVWHFCQAKRQLEAYTLMAQEGIFADLQRWGNYSVLLEIYQYLEPTKSWKPTPKLAVRIYNESGTIQQAIGQRQKAEYFFTQARQQLRALNAPEDLVDVLNNLGTVYRQQERLEEAFACYQEAKNVGDASQGIIAGRGTTFNNLGYIYTIFGHQLRRQERYDEEQQQYQQALSYYQQAIPLHQEARQDQEETRTINNIGELYQALKQEAIAYTYHQQALQLARKQGDRWLEATILNDLGVLAKKWQPTVISTQEYYKQALMIFRAIGAREDERTLLKNLGYWYLTRKDYVIAFAFFTLARNIFNELHSPSREEISRMVMRELHLALGVQGLQALQKDVEIQAEQIIEQALQE